MFFLRSRFVLQMVLISGLWVGCLSHPLSAQTKTVMVVRTDGQPEPLCDVYWAGGQFARKLPVRADGKVKIPKGEGVLVISKKGFQFGGCIVTKGNAPSKLTLYRIDEPGPKLVTRPIPVSKEDQKEQLALLKEFLWEGIHQGGSIPPSQSALDFLAFSDFEQYRSYVEEASKQFGSDRSGIAMKVLLNNSIISYLAKNDPDRAMEFIAKEKDSMIKVSYLLELQKKLPEKHTAHELIYKKIVQESQNIRPTSMRLGFIGGASEWASVRGLESVVTKVIKKELEAIKNLGRSARGGYVRSLYAGLVLDFDPELAEKLSQTKGSRTERIRARARFAFHCCRNHPGKAIEIMKQLVEASKKNATAKQWQFTYFSKITFHLAKKHPEKLEELVSLQSDPVNRSWLWLVAGIANEKTNPVLTKKYFEKCLGLLETSGQSADSRTSPNRVLHVAMPYLEKHLPGRVNGALWLSYFHFVPKGRWVTDDGKRFQYDKETIACGVSRFNKELSDIILVGRKFDRFATNNPRALANLIILQPENLAESIDSKMESRGRFASFMSGSDVALFQRDADRYWKRASWLPYHEFVGPVFDRD